jgi:hypothetical protein
MSDEQSLLRADIAAATAHRACCGTEHDVKNGKFHGYCVVCGVPWPCETAKYFIRSVPDPIGDALRAMSVIGTLNIDDPHDPKNKELKL